MKAPDYVIEAVLDTVKWAMVYCRNYSIDERADIRLVYEIMDAVHDIPDQVYRWSDDDGLDLIRLHLGCFNYSKWKGAPNLVQYFDDALDRARA
ncbi:hypothetical protein [Gynuella sunshinyii]|uniref:hypothetical protein n=1 Tax=Gynuella sunshinyii TaxID=1445505 RepID=UPI0005CBDA0E|nr:hypothetical protein [Gynuella sunshinyii]